MSKMIDGYNEAESILAQSVACDAAVNGEKHEFKCHRCRVPFPVTRPAGNVHGRVMFMCCGKLQEHYYTQRSRVEKFSAEALQPRPFKAAEETE